MKNKKAALLSVSTTEGLLPFARLLQEEGFTLLTTTGTGAFLKKNGISSLKIEEYTGQKEILGGRVKTLHPKIHAGILAKRDDESDRNDLISMEAFNIDVVVVSLYPFREKVRSGSEWSHRELVELIDIGGATLLRAAAKNSEFVLVAGNHHEYEACMEQLKNSDGEVSKIPLEFKVRQALSAFSQLVDDTSQIYATFQEKFSGHTKEEVIILHEAQRLRYGENPHQKAGFFLSCTSPLFWTQRQGKELSYNNILDLDASFSLIKPFLSETSPVAVIIKHTNPCGAAYGESVLDAVRKSKLSDPRSHFGGIIVVNKEVTEEVAEEVASDFAEIFIAPSFSEAALSRLSKMKNLRVIDFNADLLLTTQEVRTAAGGFLIQEKDPGSSIHDSATVSMRAASSYEHEDLAFAWKLCAQVKSNAIVLVKNGTLIGTGAGQMSRIDSVELALKKASVHGHSLKGAVAASDAFFPFPDGVETLGDAGISAIVVPGGAKRDPEIIEACNKREMALLFAKNRHFKH